MNQQANKKGGFNLGPLIIIIIALLNMFGRAGLVIILPIILVSVFAWRQKQAQKEETREQNLPRRAERTPQNPTSTVPTFNRTPSRNGLGIPPSGGGSEAYRNRVRELQDLLQAGIIEKDEYDDRIHMLSYEQF